MSDMFRLLPLTPRRSLSAPQIPLLSAYAGGACDDAMATSLSFWRRVQTAPANGERALKTLAEQCQIILNLGSLTGDRHGYSCPIVTGSYIEEALGQLYEAGCDIDWKKLESRERRLMERLPGYAWAADET